MSFGLEPNRLRPTLLLLAAVPLGAAAQDYNRCIVPTTHYVNNSGQYCIPAPGAQVPGRGLTFDVGNGGFDNMVLALPARNCRGPSNQYQGDVVLLLDSSQSLEKTDPNDERMTGTDGFVAELVARTAGDAVAPSLGVISYGGRLRFLKDDPNRPGKPLYEKPADTTRAHTAVFDLVSCVDGDDTAELLTVYPAGQSREALADPFPSTDATTRWNDRTLPSDPYPLSTCEFLRAVSSQSTAVDSSTPGMERQKEFLKLPKGNPRGATDVSYMLDAMVDANLLGGSTKLARHAIVITDGLPNTPVRRTKEFCLQKAYLPNSDFETDPNSPVPEELYCLDRNFREGVDAAHAKVLEKFGQINIHHILYWSQPDESFIDFDDQGTLNPADFLIENSARSGNGKVKFDFAQGPDELKRALNNILQRFDTNALQRVDITVTDSSGTTKPTYSAVSASDFASDLNSAEKAQEQRFDLKILYLKTGTNSVKIDYVYADTTVSETLTVNVLANFTSTSSLECEAKSSSFTVDGDRKDYPYCLNRDSRDVVPAPPSECRGSNQPEECTCKAPEGDGFLPFPDENGNVRVYRNADATNETFEKQEQFSDVVTYGTDNGSEDPRNLRIQGGTGNCGVVGGLGKQASRRASALGLALLVSPLLFLLGWGLLIQRQKRLSEVRSGREPL